MSKSDQSLSRQKLAVGSDTTDLPPWQSHLLHLEALRVRAKDLQQAGAMSPGASLSEKFAVGDFLNDLESLVKSALHQAAQTFVPGVPQDKEVSTQCRAFRKAFLEKRPGTVSTEVIQTYGRMAAIWPAGDLMRSGRLSYSHLRLLAQQRDSVVREDLLTRVLLENLSANELQKVINARKAREHPTSGTTSTGTTYICTYSGAAITDLDRMVEIQVPPTALKPGSQFPDPSKKLRGPASRGQGTGIRHLRFADMHSLHAWLAQHVDDFLPAVNSLPSATDTKAP